jgi:hypothetical protein
MGPCTVGKTRLSRAAAGALVAVLVTCTCSPGADARPEEQATSTTAPGGRAVSNRDLIGAMLSIHANAYWRGALPESLHVPSLDGAVAVLKADRAFWSLRRRAIAELMAYGELGQLFEPQLKALGADVQGIKDAMHRELAAQSACSAYLLKNPILITSKVSNLIANQPALGGISAAQAKACDWQEVDVPTVSCNKDGPVRIDAKVSIGPPIDVATVAKDVDPQRWDNCSKFWDPPENATYIAQQPVQIPPGIDPNPPAVGSAYVALPLFEFFSCSSEGFDAFFKNVLTITTSSTDIGEDGNIWPNGRRMTYSLPPENGFIAGEIGGEKAKVIIDQGWVEAWVDGARTVVKSHKEVQFEDPVQTGSMQAFLTFVELSQELAELACCIGKAAP